MKEEAPFFCEIEHVSELETKTGTLLGISPWREITQEMILEFAQVTRDHQWIHTDPERAARESPFGTTIAHGYLILSLCSSFVEQTLKIRHLTMMVNYGLNRVRFTHPVTAGSSIRGRTTLKSYEATPKGVTLALELTIELQRVDRPACVAEVVLLCV